ncbi:MULTISPECIES: carboxylate-amine ligase [Hymenobacter]|uniref:Putative glutamate--cysteine ligase 2 n=1 Tax=Hymenobacter mucosus TaxID=1411120 RepID=A0A238XG67_9BACT|nr:MULTISPECIES: carboxylate-amine ligase [Hymenobacter]SNR57598.1 carboxylate-amine ligase [Hymenobacter mucosus]
MPEFTIGIEEEFQTIDPVTRDLRSHMSEIVEGGKVVLQEQVKAEMHQSVVEVGTVICRNIQEAREQVTYLRKMVIDLAAKAGLRIAAAGTHPFSRWQDQPITPDARYDKIVEELQEAARSNLVFGMHVHIGLENRELGVYVMNTLRYFLPHIFALSTNSPFWEGRETGYKSFRTKVFERFPRTGIPDYFGSASEYDEYIALLVKTGCIDNGKKIWWDLRLHPFFDTIEYRICDMPLRVDETVALAAVMQAVVAKIYKLKTQNLNFRLYRKALINENKWRAARYGLDGKLIDFGKETEVPTRELIMELLEFVDDVLDELGSRKEVEYILQMMEMGTGADRQLKVFRETNDLKKVVDFIMAETSYGLI